MFFVPDVDNQEWKVVLKAEPRSRRVGDEVEEPIVGASGLADFGRSDEVLQIPTVKRASGVQDVATAEVDLVDARLEAEDAMEQYLDVDYVDDEDDCEEEDVHEIIAV